MATYQKVILFLIFDAIERDLIRMMKEHLMPVQQIILGADEERKARDRLSKRDRDDLYNAADHYDLLEGLDIGDKYDVLLRHSAALPADASAYLKRLKTQFQKSIPIRNDTMHGRPLTVEDYTFSFAFTEQLIRRPDLWKDLSKVVASYRANPESLIAKGVQFFEDDGPSETLHNLPIRDYDDTGFLQRSALEAELKQKILGRFPIVTVLGEGGNGKSALTLQTAYRLAISGNHDFDAIVWTSAKSHMLSASEISRIEGSITDSLGIFQEVADSLEPGEEAPTERVYRLMKQNKILLIIDNLETVLDDRMRQFAENVPGHSKIVFTSRVPLGGDLSVSVGAFAEEEAKMFLRRLIDAYSIGALRAASDSLVARYIRRLNCKPLLIKWFAHGVTSGLAPESIMQNSHIALKYCMSNVIDRLSEGAKKAAHAFAISSGSHSPSVIQFVTGQTAEETEAAISALQRYALIVDGSKNMLERTFTMSPFAREYMLRIAKRTDEDDESLLKGFRAIEGAYQSERVGKTRNPYETRCFTVRSASEAVAVQQLRNALHLIYEGNHDEASRIIEDLMIVSGGYFEVHRIAAFNALRMGDLIGARNHYETAIDIDNRQPQLLYWYGGFLMRALADYSKAAEIFDQALSLDSNSSAVFREAARNMFFAGRFDESQAYIDRALGLEGNTHKDNIILHDLQAQLFIRQAESWALVGDAGRAMNDLTRLQEFVSGIDRSFIDRTFVEHVKKARFVSYRVRNRLLLAGNAEIERFEAWLAAFSDRHETIFAEEERPRGVEHTLSEIIMRHGVLKHNGLQPTFGFITCDDGSEVFLHKSAVSVEVWRLLQEGCRAKFQVVTTFDGRTKAVNLELV